MMRIRRTFNLPDEGSIIVETRRKNFGNYKQMERVISEVFDVNFIDTTPSKRKEPVYLVRSIISLLEKNGGIWQGNINVLRANLGLNLEKASTIERKLRRFGIHYGIKVTFLAKARKRLRLELLQNRSSCQEVKLESIVSKNNNGDNKLGAKNKNES